ARSPRADVPALQPAAARIHAGRQRGRELLPARHAAAARRMSVDAVLFDLDGTLVDTAPDLVAVLNRLLLEDGRPPAPYALARNHASDGALGLIRLGFGPNLPADELEALRS